MSRPFSPSTSAISVSPSDTPARPFPARLFWWVSSGMLLSSSVASGSSACSLPDRGRRPRSWHAAAVRAYAHDRYTIPLPAHHRFPAGKYRLTREAAARELPWLQVLEAPALGWEEL